MIIFTILLASFAFTSGAEQKTEEENRPYEFGFNIEGYQHRHEKKDERGIIMGEFGFVTGDGVYHLTVYATDENGDFKILKMKNFYIGLPGDMTTTTTQPPKKTLTGQQGCSGCLIPEVGDPRSIKPGKPGVNLPQQNDNIDIRIQQENNHKSAGKQNLNNYGNNNIKQPVLSKQSQINVKSGDKQNYIGNRNVNQPEISRQKENSIVNSGEKLNYVNNNIGKPQRDDVSNSRTNSNEDDNIKKSRLIKGIIKEEKSGGDLSMKDLMGLLYRFNYTLSYHGHNEEGTKGGDKKGSYQVSGRDGYRREVTYTANQFGYQPNISLVALKPEDTPQEETEKQMTELKGNEFVWFY